MLRRLEVSELLLGRAFRSQRTRIPVEEFYEWFETDQVGKSGKQAAVCVAVGRRAAGALARSIGVVVRLPTLIRKSPRPGARFRISRGLPTSAPCPSRHGDLSRPAWCGSCAKWCQPNAGYVAVARTRGRQSCW